MLQPKFERGLSAEVGLKVSQVGKVRHVDIEIETVLERKKERNKLIKFTAFPKKLLIQ